MMLVGIADPSGKLTPDQVFVQIETSDGNLQCIQGPIAVTKNPCLHPGGMYFIGFDVNE